MTRILIADDNPRNLYLLETILKGSSYEAVPARNGAEALARAREAPLDLIITDILMPVMELMALVIFSCNSTMSRIDAENSSG